MHIKDISSSIHQDSLLKKLISNFHNFRNIHVNIQNLKRKRGIKHNHTPAIKRRFREIVDYISTGTRKSIF